MASQQLQRSTSGLGGWDTGRGVQLPFRACQPPARGFNAPQQRRCACCRQCIVKAALQGVTAGGASSEAALLNALPAEAAAQLRQAGEAAAHLMPRWQASLHATVPDLLLPADGLHRGPGPHADSHRPLAAALRRPAPPPSSCCRCTVCCGAAGRRRWVQISTAGRSPGCHTTSNWSSWAARCCIRRHRQEGTCCAGAVRDPRHCGASLGEARPCAACLTSRRAVPAVQEGLLWMLGPGEGGCGAAAAGEVDAAVLVFATANNHKTHGSWLAGTGGGGCLGAAA